MQVRLTTAYPHIAVALSGGPDSWALALLAQRWCAANNAKLTAITVDHMLRAGSTAEAAAVAAECARRGIHHAVLPWHHETIETRIQERAREARYRLLLDYCKSHGIPALLTAHHADDQAETILMRIAKASDVGGLAGLRRETVQDGIKIIRPLLDYTKQQLVEFACAENAPFATDPSNENANYARVRLRQARDVLEAEGLNTATLQKLADKMAAADEALAFAAQELILKDSVWLNDVVLELPLTSIELRPPALQQRALQIIWRHVTGGADYPLERDAIIGALKSDQPKLTFGGMVMEKTVTALRFYRELEGTSGPVDVEPFIPVIWDRRFIIYNNTKQPVRIQALGMMPTAELEKSCPWATAIKPAAARATLPACDNLPVSLEPDVKSAIYARALHRAVC